MFEVFGVPIDILGLALFGVVLVLIVLHLLLSLRRVKDEEKSLMTDRLYHAKLSKASQKLAGNPANNASSSENPYSGSIVGWDNGGKAPSVRASGSAAPVAKGGRKLENAFERIERIEGMLVSGDTSAISFEFAEKLRRLDNFRANTEVELKAMREMLPEIKRKLDDIHTSTLSVKQDSAADPSANEMHKIIYRSR